jgi:hypothetical protein
MGYGAPLVGSPWPALDLPVPRDAYIRDKFTRELTTARKVAREYFERYPKDRYETEVESWRHLQSANIEFTMKRLREPGAAAANLHG